MSLRSYELSTPEAARTAIAGEVFKNITINPALKILRFPSPNEFVLRYAAGSALASLLAGADDDARTALLAEVDARLHSYVDDQGLAFPIESNVAVARK